MARWSTQAQGYGERVGGIGQINVNIDMSMFESPSGLGNPTGDVMVFIFIDYLDSVIQLIIYRYLYREKRFISCSFFRMRISRAGTGCPTTATDSRKAFGWGWIPKNK